MRGLGNCVFQTLTGTVGIAFFSPFAGTWNLLFFSPLRGRFPLACGHLEPSPIPSRCLFHLFVLLLRSFLCPVIGEKTAAPPPWPPKKDPLFIFQRPCSPLPFQSAGVRCGKDRVLINRFLFIFSVWAWNGKVWYIAGLSPGQSRGFYPQGGQLS